MQVGNTIDAAAFWFLSLDKTCTSRHFLYCDPTLYCLQPDASPGHAQLLVDAAESGSGHKRTLIPEDEARFSYQQVGTPEKGWLAFQPYYDEILAKSGGSFLK